MNARMRSPGWASITKIAVLMLALASLAATRPRIQAIPATWYVNGRCASCGEGTRGAPFRTIAEAVARAGDGDTIRVAQGTYKENLALPRRVTLMGGYDARGGEWVRNPARYETRISGADRTRPGDWNGDTLGPLCVVKDDHAYRMWYSARNEVYGERIGYADSPDGVRWFQPYRDALLGPGGAGAWDEAGLSSPTVLLTNIGLQMWYVGLNSSGERAIGYATSSDGLTWHKQGAAPVLRADAVDGDAFGFPTVIRDDSGDYKMWYSGGDRIWLATSSDGTSWTKRLQLPAVSPGSAGAWDDVRVYAPVVVYASRQYRMWYVGEGSAETGPQIGYAWSQDGLTWRKPAQNPVVVGAPGYWELAAVNYPAVILDGAEYKMWYGGGGSDPRAIGSATSADGQSWTRYHDNPVLTTGSPTHWGRPVVTFGTGSAQAVLDGLTISDGYAEYGGGIYAYEAASTIRACRVVGNTAHRGGGGLWLGSGVYALEDTVVEGNASHSRGGGIVLSNAQATIRDSRLADNEAGDYGGAMVAWGRSRLALVDTALSQNRARWGGGLNVGDGSSVDLDGSVVEGNRAEQAAGLRVVFATVAMTNTFVVDNEATVSGPGGISLWNSSGRLVNTTIAGNKTKEGIGGVLFGTGDPSNRLTILNSILFFNSNGDVSCSGGDCTVTWSDLSAQVPGSGNISANPLFVDRIAGDYHLGAGSPAIDAGTDQGAPLVDFEGDPRPAGRVDMGADEFVHRPAAIGSPLQAKRILFVHHSVGRITYAWNVYDPYDGYVDSDCSDGECDGLARWFHENTPHEIKEAEWPYGHGQNDPQIYVDIWAGSACSEVAPKLGSEETRAELGNVCALEDMTAHYDAIVFKTCFTESGIDEATMVRYRQNYETLGALFDRHPETTFVAWNLFPNLNGTVYDRQFSEWMRDEWAPWHPNVWVFDAFEAMTYGSQNSLYSGYRWGGNHPIPAAGELLATGGTNAAGEQVVGLGPLIVKVIRRDYPVKAFLPLVLRSG